jgi:hypothetical protein
MMNTRYLFLVIVLSSFSTWSQVEKYTVKSVVIQPINMRFLNDTNVQTHLGIQPIYEPIQVLPSNAPKRGISVNLAGDTTSIIEVPAIVIRDENKKGIRPAVDTYVKLDTSFSLQTAVGANFQFMRKKWVTKNQLLLGYTNENSSQQTPTAFQAVNPYKRSCYADIRSRTVITPTKMLRIQAGIDNQFFGHGYRSLIQSEQVAPMPFASLHVRFWHFEYGLLYQFLQETDSIRHWKFNATHYLSWNITKKWNVTLLENVLFQPSDGAFKRGFEVEYLNPIVFFRPQEYSLGSADNVLMSLQTSFRSNKQLYYGQVILDEFVLHEIKTRSKWWANKYGIQLGLKGEWKKFQYLTELNLVRPYTFSHINTNQNAGNLGRPLGHPLGSNFVELIAIIRHHYRNIQLHYFVDYYLKGFDENTVSWGGNIYQNYVNHPLEYGNTIGQGLTQHTLKMGLAADYLIHPLNVTAFIQFTGNYSWGELNDHLVGGITIGLRSQLFSTRRIFP